MLCTSKGCRGKMKGTWWWNAEVKEKVKEKQEAYAAIINSKTEEEKVVSKGRYKATKKVAKIVIAMAKNIAYERLYQKLETMEGK